MIVKIKYALIILILISKSVFAQQTIFDNQALSDDIKNGVDYIYNYEFAKAEKIYEMLIRERPDHPSVPLFHAMMLYWEYFPLTHSSAKSREFVSSLETGIDITEKTLKINENNTEGIFFNMIARLMLMQYYADNEMTKKIFPHISPAYKMASKGFMLKEELNEFYYSTGIYNYYREEYPEAHPGFKPIALFFPKGNKKLGLQQIDYAGEHTVFLSVEAFSYLVFIYMYYENNYATALEYAKKLNKRFPDNPLYLSYCIQLLLILKQYEEADYYINELWTYAKENRYFELLYLLYRGVIEEKKNKNFNLSEELYTKSLLISKDYGAIANEQSSFAYFGLSRIYNQQGNIKKAKDLRKTALSYSTFPKVNFD
jgi:tetratricopeptide (TPR) repeat protein